jgi:hypothetical protein
VSALDGREARLAALDAAYGKLVRTELGRVLAGEPSAYLDARRAPAAVRESLADEGALALLALEGRVVALATQLDGGASGERELCVDRVADAIAMARRERALSRGLAQVLDAALRRIVDAHGAWAPASVAPEARGASGPPPIVAEFSLAPPSRGRSGRYSLLPDAGPGDR